VRNPLAQKHLRFARKGDRILYYHTGKEKTIVAVAAAATDAYPDPDDDSGKSVVVDIVPVERLKRPVSLAELKADRQFADFPLVRMPRLSVMPVGDKEWRAIRRMAGE
jgi:predicted RNA-binding protein with PUA-like domain